MLQHLLTDNNLFLRKKHTELYLHVCIYTHLSFLLLLGIRFQPRRLVRRILLLFVHNNLSYLEFFRDSSSRLLNDTSKTFTFSYRVSINFAGITIRFGINYLVIYYFNSGASYSKLPTLTFKFGHTTIILSPIRMVLCLTV